MTKGLTRNNIAHNLKISPYTLEVDYLDGTLTYVFSSELYKTKFFRSFREHRRKVNESIAKRFGIDVVFDRLADIKLYDTIEKRGFLILLDNGEKIECLNNIILDGNKVITKI